MIYYLFNVFKNMYTIFLLFQKQPSCKPLFGFRLRLTDSGLNKDISYLEYLWIKFSAQVHSTVRNLIVIASPQGLN